MATYWYVGLLVPYFHYFIIHFSYINGNFFRNLEVIIYVVLKTLVSFFYFLCVFSDVFYLGLANNLYTFNIVILDIIYYIHLLYSVCTYKHLTFIFKISLAMFN